MREVPFPVSKPLGESRVQQAFALGLRDGRLRRAAARRRRNRRLGLLCAFSSLFVWSSAQAFTAVSGSCSGDDNQDLYCFSDDSVAMADELNVNYNALLKSLTSKFADVYVAGAGSAGVSAKGTVDVNGTGTNTLGGSGSHIAGDVNINDKLTVGDPGAGTSANEFYAGANTTIDGYGRMRVDADFSDSEGNGVNIFIYGGTSDSTDLTSRVGSRDLAVLGCAEGLYLNYNTVSGAESTQNPEFTSGTYLGGRPEIGVRRVNCSYSGSGDKEYDCSCGSGEAVLSGGINSDGNHLHKNSYPVDTDNDGTFDAWRTLCVNRTDGDGSPLEGCGDVHVLCGRLQPLERPCEN